MIDIVERLRADGETVKTLEAKGHWSSAKILEQADTITALRSEVERLRAAQQWRPIESAPKDGMPVQVGWIGRTWEASKSHCEYGEWGYLTREMGFIPWCEQPTHWLPLPPPPENTP